MEFLAILTDSIKLVPKHGKLMALIALFSLVFSSLLWVFSFSIQSLLLAMSAAVQQSLMPAPDSTNSGFDPGQMIHLLHQLRQDAASLCAAQLSFILVLSIVSIFLSTKTSSLKHLFSMMWATWTNALITSFYAAALSTAYFMAVAAFATPLLIYPDLPISWLYPLIFVPSSILYLYLSVPWIVSIVVAVVEEDCCGMEALGKAAVLVKGRRLHGFLLNLHYGLLFLIDFTSSYIETQLVITAISFLVKILMFVSFTVFYFQCKMQHGEEREVQLHPSFDYTKLSTAAVLAQDMP